MFYFASGDAGFYFREQIQAMTWLPDIWREEYGFGVSVLSRLWFDYPYQLLVKLLSSIGLSWWMIDKILWFGMFILAFYSAYKIGFHIFHVRKWALQSAIIYSSNTYILLLFAGGQIGVALAYAVAPVVLLRFINTIENPRKGVYTGLVSGISYALLVIFDLRIAAIVFLSVLIYLFVMFRDVKKSTSLFVSFLVSIIVAVGLNSFWILPVFAGGGKALGITEEITHPGMLKFLSFADFSHALSLLHPNWPENYFGKVYFLQPEFLIFPIFAFAGLYFLKYPKLTVHKNNKLILYFSVLSLFGIFMAKGVNEPFGLIYNWLFLNIPGFSLFRDPTKFYLFISLGYSILIPFTFLSFTVIFLKQKSGTIFYVFFILFWIFTLRQVFTGGVRGNFSPPKLTMEDMTFKNELVNDSTPSRVLWVPLEDSFAYFSPEHPVLRFGDLYGSVSAEQLPEVIVSGSFKTRLSDAGIGYVVVPPDHERNIFLDNYSFSASERNKLIQSLDLSGLARDEKYEEYAVYKNPESKFILQIPEFVRITEKAANNGLLVSISSLLFSLAFAFRRIKK